MFDLIPIINGLEFRHFLYPLSIYFFVAFLGALATIVFRMLVIYQKKGSLFSFTTFFAENWKGTIIGFVASFTVITLLYMIEILGIDNSNTHMILAITLGSSGDGALGYFFDHVVKSKNDFTPNWPSP